MSAALVGLVASPSLAAEPEAAPPSDSAAEEPAPTPRWRFKHADKPVKVVVLAGSIGAFPKQPYAKEIARLCKNVEVHNLSKANKPLLVPQCAATTLTPHFKGSSKVRGSESSLRTTGTVCSPPV